MAGRTPKKDQQGVVFDSEAALMIYLQAVQKRRGMSTTLIAHLSGIDRRQVARIISGEKSPMFTSLLKICNTLGVKVHFETQLGTPPDFGIRPQNWIVSDLTRIEENELSEGHIICPTCGGYGRVLQTPAELDGGVLKIYDTDEIKYYGYSNLIEIECPRCYNKGEILEP